MRNHLITLVLALTLPLLGCVSAKPTTPLNEATPEQMLSLVAEVEDYVFVGAGIAIREKAVSADRVRLWADNLVFILEDPRLLGGPHFLSQAIMSAGLDEEESIIIVRAAERLINQYYDLGAINAVLGTNERMLGQALVDGLLRAADKYTVPADDPQPIM